MIVTTDQLVPGVILAEDIIGKSSKPLIPNKTILTEEHIHFLNKFLIDEVTIESRLNDGTLFVPE